jgi:selT/selW/selH-like putative selenoprotein
MQRYFLEVKSFLETNPRYTAFKGNIYGSNYPPPYHAQIIANVTSSLWVIGILLLIFGDYIFKAIGIQEPEFYVFMKNNKMGVFFGLFVLNNLGSQQLATGAFEIYVDDVLIYSKLETHRLPSPDDILKGLESLGYK